MGRIPLEQKENGPVHAKPAERILQAALELFVEQGYFNTNVPDISRRSHCSVGSIYHHFLNKEEIASQLYKDGLLRFRHALCAVVDPAEGLETTVRKVVVNFLQFAEQNRLLSQYLWLSRHTEFLTSKIMQPTVVGFDELGRRLTKVIKQAARNGEIAPLRAPVIWTIVFGIPISYIRDWLDGYVPAAPSSVAPALADACVAALKGTKRG